MPGRLLVSSDRRSSEFNVSVQVIYSFRSTVFEQALLSLLYVAGIVHCSYTKGPSLRP